MPAFFKELAGETSALPCHYNFYGAHPIAMYYLHNQLKKDNIYVSKQGASENLVFRRVRGHPARIFTQDAGETPAHPGVFGGCRKFQLTRILNEKIQN